MPCGRVCICDLLVRQTSALKDTGLPKIAAERDFWEEEEPPCKSSVLLQGKMLTAQACSDEVRDQEVEKRHPLCRVFVCAGELSIRPLGPSNKRVLLIEGSQKSQRSEIFGKRRSRSDQGDKDQAKRAALPVILRSEATKDL